MSDSGVLPHQRRASPPNGRQVNLWRVGMYDLLMYRLILKKAIRLRLPAGRDLTVLKINDYPIKTTPLPLTTALPTRADSLWRSDNNDVFLLQSQD